MRVDRELAAALLRVNVPTIYHPKIVNVVEIDHDITKEVAKSKQLARPRVFRITAQSNA